jgi:hypothetical protein
MLATLGNVVYWLGCGVAVITVVAGFKFWFAAGNEAFGFSILFWTIAVRLTSLHQRHAWR